MKNDPMKKAPASSLAKLWHYMTQHKSKIILVILLSIFSSAFSIAGPKLLGTITTAIFNGTVGDQGINFQIINKTALLLVLLYVTSAVFNGVQGIVMRNVAQDVSYELRKSVMEKINRLPISYFDRVPVGETLSKVTNDVDLISQNLNQTLTQVVSSITTILGIFIMMLTISVPMTGAAFLMIPASVILVRIIVKMSQNYFFLQQKNLGVVNGNIEETYTGQSIIKAFTAEDKAIKDFELINEDLYSSGWKSQFYSNMMMPILSFVGNAGYVAIAILGGVLAANGSIQVGDILAFVQYVRNMNQPIGQSAQIASLLQATVAAADRVFQLLEEPEEKDDCEAAENCNQYVPKLNHEGHIEFKDVYFGYDPNHMVIQGFNLDVENGSTVAIVGATGAGKTTIVKLLMRFYDINSGSILIDGVDIRNTSKSELRAEFGMVLQDTWLFNGTIMDNIRYANHDATDDQVIEAAKLAQADGFIRQLPNGYHMILNDESDNISQGQKQLLTIARAVLKDPDILILDEATSSVDTRTEVLIQEAMKNLMQGRTNFVIAHRLSTIKNADKILVMDKGNIVEQGNHDELLQLKGLYYNLYQSQFEE